jgi:hypothetical protein
MPGPPARRFDALSVQFLGDGAHTRDGRAINTLDDSHEVRRAPLGPLLDLGDSFSVAGLLAPKGASAVWVAELDPTGLGGSKSVFCTFTDQARPQPIDLRAM